VLTAAMKTRGRDLLAPVAAEGGVSIANGVVSREPVHVFVSLPPHGAVAPVVTLAKGGSSRTVQAACPALRKTYGGRHWGARGYVSATRGTGTDDLMNASRNRQSDAHEPPDARRIRLE
jgi:putative transposase